MVNVTMINGIPAGIQLVNNSGQIYEVHPLECVFVCQSHAEYNTKAMDSGQRLTQYRVLCWYDRSKYGNGILVLDGREEIPHKVIKL